MKGQKKPNPRFMQGQKLSKVRKVHAETPVEGERMTGDMERTTGPIRSFFRRRFRGFVRNQIASGLAQSGKYDWRSAREMVDDLTDKELDAKIEEWKEEQSIQEPDDRAGGLGDGTFLQWLMDHKEQILELVKFIMSIFMMFGSSDTMKLDKNATFLKSESPKSKVDPTTKAATGNDTGSAEAGEAPKTRHEKETAKETTKKKH